MREEVNTTCWFAGLTTVDLVHRADRPPAPNEKITALRQDLAAGGPAANAAVVAAAMGRSPLLITAIGAGPVGALARHDLEANGVRLLDAGPRHEMSVSAVLVDDATGERSVVSTDAGSTHTVAPDLDAEPTPRVVLLDGHHPDLQRDVLARARECGATVVLDAGRRRPIFAELIPHADVVACSADFRTATGDSGPDALLALGARGVVITAGAGPVTWVDARGSGRVEVPRVAVRDTLGAGDAFHGALVAALTLGAELEAAVRTAVEVASLRVREVGPRTYLRAVRARFGGR
ncbi:carbohydrate kinase family protein [Pseudactinotalea sp. HY158]|uniref:carbohydrate kinase family protein n=1 Tax=Pseudactinotalea sp. HY158 TaxID=2654547 RepID=UPI00129C2733|nr:PfkB family carbohydrate kinase [Pseudactinotalea sp. HY158]QGH70800.1 carbohydrate kinase [Pseudactinotalea sp. HY158]